MPAKAHENRYREYDANCQQHNAVAAAGWLRGTDPKILAHGLALAGIHAPIQSASAYSRLGHNAKEGIPWGVLSGLAALDLAQSGFSGPLPPS